MKPRNLIVAGLFLLAGVWTATLKDARGCLDLMEYGAVMQALPQSVHSLADAIRSCPTTAPEEALSARFGTDDQGQILLSVYTAKKGRAESADSNSFRELSGSPASSELCLNAQALDDSEHVAQAAEQLTLLSLSPFSLVDILNKAESDHTGTAFSITPVIDHHKGQFLVLLADGPQVIRLRYDLTTGALIQPPAEVAMAGH